MQMKQYRLQTGQEMFLRVQDFVPGVLTDVVVTAMFLKQRLEDGK
jgi:hypothetical protein